MKKLLGLALLAGAATAGTAHAEGSFSGNIALTTDYVFRGISQTQNSPAVQGGFDYANGMFYVGTWASNVDFGDDAGVTVHAPMELDLYAGIKPVTGPVTWDLGIVGYFYPGSTEPFAGSDKTDFNYYELKAAPTISPMQGLTLGASLFYSPEFSGSTDSALYYEVNGAYTINDMFSVSGAFGHQTTDQSNTLTHTQYYFLSNGKTTDEYSTWNLGVTAAVLGFSVDLRYTDADEDILSLSPTPTTITDSKAVLTIKRAL